MRHLPIISLLAAAPLALAACGGAEDRSASPAGTPASTPGNPSPTRTVSLVTKEGRIESGVECAVLHTPDGEIWALTGTGEAERGDYVEVTGEAVEASFCMQGEGTIDPRSVEPAEAPPRDRDPARSGGLAVTTAYAVGSWVAKGVQADCGTPDFRVTTNANGLALFEGKANGKQETAALSVGRDPALHFDEPLPSPRVETRGPDGLAILPPASGAINIAGHPIEGDGVVFIKCA